MNELLPFVIGALFWAWMTESSTRGKYGVHRQHHLNMFPYFMLVLTLALPIALRTTYNDTYAYIKSFREAETIGQLLNSEELHLLENPLFRICESLVRTITDNCSIFFTIDALFVQYSYVRFIRRHSPSLVMGIALYIFLGTYVFAFAAMKQVTAMAVLLYAVDALMERKLRSFYLLVTVAFLFHTYAAVFLLLPLFTVKPWTPRFYMLLISIFFVMANFEPVISTFLKFANDSGKNISADEVIGTAGINPIRVAVYAVTPLFALVFHPYLFTGRGEREHNILINMSFLTVAIMSVGLVNAANMFARMGQYFEFGIICGLPWMISKPFEKDSERLMQLLAMTCFAGFFYYANALWMPFDANFTRYTVAEFAEGILQSILFR